MALDVDRVVVELGAQQLELQVEHGLEQAGLDQAALTPVRKRRTRSAVTPCAMWQLSRWSAIDRPTGTGPSAFDPLSQGSPEIDWASRSCPGRSRQGPSVP